ncbi:MULTISPECIES: hypothetical protein [unclassified Streptomyces]|jgi:hypothetical protein|uniref:hypothetical protein n=1 Tax=Streptomyces sp. NPDC005955 TaxID=3364738 RepID=UPI003679705A
MQARLGPLERYADGGGGWIIGDPRQEGGAFFVLRADGAAHRAAGAPERVVTWDRFLDLDTLVTSTRESPRPTGGATDLAGEVPAPGAGSCLRATLRDPDENWVGRFSHHARLYTVSEVLLAGELLRQTVEAGHAAWLGDLGWLDHTVGRLAPLEPRTNRAARLAVAEVLAS